MVDSGATMHGWATDLFPICRSLTGDGVRETLDYLQALLPGLARSEVPSGTRVMDWTVPDEWNIKDAYVADLEGNRLIDFAQNNLHVVGYSTPVDETLSRAELEPHLHSLPEQPDAIPYVTSYYSRNWGFCLTQRQRDELGDGLFRVVIDSTLVAGSLTYADIVIPGESTDEILLSTYFCHPSMANNELSGPVVATALARWLLSLENRRYTYRIVFLPETIGSITYLAEHLVELQSRVRAGWVLTCIGDDRTYSYLESRLGGTLADRVSLQVLEEADNDFISYSFLERGSDERQWCAPGVDLPVASLMRSKYGEFPEYHTSLDDLTLVTPSGLQGGFEMMREAIELVEANLKWRVTTLGEPQLGPRGLYPNTSTKASTALVRDMMNVLAYCDGEHDVIDIARICGISTGSVREIVGRMAVPGLVEATR
jgi:aminopeptidase-like protein